MSTWRTPELKALAKTISKIKTEADLLNFLRDLCTLEELASLSMRWNVVQMLAKGKAYRDIAKATGASTTTITRIAHWLENGEGGYKKALSTNRS